MGVANRPCELLKGHQGECWDRLDYIPQGFGISKTDLRQAKDYWAVEHAEITWDELVPSRYSCATFDRLGLADNIMGPLAGWLEREVEGELHGSLVLLGDKGSGKTHTACAVAREFYVKHVGAALGPGPAVRIVSAPDMIRSLLPNGGNKLTDYTNPDLLVLDDLGTEAGTDTATETLFRVIDGRYREERNLIVTSNLHPEQLEQWVGVRTYDRLRHDGIAIVIPGASRRKAAA